MQEPSSKKSRTESEDPNLATPKSETADPTRLQALNDREAAKCEKSNTDIDEPTRSIPNIDRLDPT